MNTKRSALGRGLSALVSTPAKPANFQVVDGGVSDTANTLEGGVISIKIDQITPNRFQPRIKFNDDELKELSLSIKESGVIQPVLLNKIAFNKYELIAGERRLRASQLAGLKEIPAIIKEVSDKESLELAIVENVQRSNLNPIEEAKAYGRLQSEFSLTHAEIAEKVGKDRVTVSNLLRLLKLSDEVIKLIEKNEISLGHAKVLLSLQDHAAQINLAKKVSQEEISVRELERIVAQVAVLDIGKDKAQNTHALVNRPKSASLLPEIEEKLRNALGTKVTLKHKPSGKGKIEIEYFSEEELDGLIQKMC